MENLSERLKAIYNMVPQGTAADIGADHGKLIIALFEGGVISHGYAVENKHGPYNRLVKALQDKELIDDIVPLYSDGIKDLPEGVHTVIIAGMGGTLIIDILKKYPQKTKQIQTLIIDAIISLKFIMSTYLWIYGLYFFSFPIVVSLPWPG